MPREGLLRTHSAGINRYALRILVDANVLSEPTRSDPNGRVVEWLRENESRIVVDPIVLGEIRFGIELLAAGKRRARLEEWFEIGIASIPCLDWDSEAGLRWATLLANLRRSGHSIPIKDSMIAATAIRYGVAVATRNVSDFRQTGVDVINPFA